MSSGHGRVECVRVKSTMGPEPESGFALCFGSSEGRATRSCRVGSMARISHEAQRQARQITRAPPLPATPRGPLPERKCRPPMREHSQAEETGYRKRNES